MSEHAKHHPTKASARAVLKIYFSVPKAQRAAFVELADGCALGLQTPDDYFDGRIAR